MRPLKYVLFAGLLGLLLLIGGLWFTVHTMNNRWRAEPGVTLEFEISNPKVEMSRELPAVRQRLAGVARQVVEQSSDRRFTVWIPYPENLQQAEARRTAALEEFRESELTPARVDALLKLPPPQRGAEIDRLAPAGTALRDPLLALAAAFDADARAHQAAATASAPASLADAATRARDAYFAALDDCFRVALNSRHFEKLLQAADDPANTAARKERDELLAAYPSQATEILHVIDAQKAWRAAGGGLTVGPEDIARLLLSPGVLDFRIALTALSPGDARLAAESLRLHGPSIPLRISIGQVRWFEIDAGNGNFNGPFVMQNWDRRTFLLCHDDHTHTLTHNDPLRKEWSISASRPARGSDLISLPFRLDAVGAGYMADLTGANLHQPMAILVDDRALSTPTLQSQISDSGQITFGRPTAARPAATIQREAQDLYQVLSQPPLPSPLRRVH